MYIELYIEVLDGGMDTAELPILLIIGLVVCIIDQPIENQRTEISGWLNISEKLGGQLVLEPGLSDIASSRTTLVQLLYTMNLPLTPILITR